MSEPLIGYRSWHLDRPDLSLRSLTGRGVWVKDGPTQAFCEPARETYKPHLAPLKECWCGLHAIGVPSFDQGHGRIRGAIAAEGRVVIHGDENPPGFRAEKAIPIAFLRPEERQIWGWLQQIADRLGVPIVSDLRSLMRVALEQGVSLNEHLEDEAPKNPPFDKGIRQHLLIHNLDRERETGDYTAEPVLVAKEKANLVSSSCYDGYHRPALDVDEMQPDKAIRILNRIWCQMGLNTNGSIPQVIPSSSPGHHHLYFDSPLTWRQYRWLLERLAVAGVIEVGFYTASVARGFSALRKPGVCKKGAQRV